MRERWLWRVAALPGAVWLAAFLVAPMYVVLFGTIDPILRRPVPVWNPVDWDPTQFQYVLERLVGPDAIFSVPRCCAPRSTSVSRACSAS